jgi:hypothetical protein
VNKLRTLYPIHNSWQITGLHLLPSDKTTWNDLKTNRYEYTLIEKEDTITSKTKINSITDSIYLPDPKEFEILSKKNTNELKWITMTLTEKGYYKKSTFRRIFVLVFTITFTTFIHCTHKYQENVFIYVLIYITITITIKEYHNH